MSILKIGSMNIQGSICRKIGFDEVKKLITNYDIFCLQETWLTDSESINMDDFTIYRSDRKENKRHCGSGGVVTLVKSKLTKGTSKISSKCNDFIWTKLDKNMLNTNNDLFICNCYIPPQNKQVGSVMKNKNTPFDILQSEIQHYGAIGDLILVGDMNSRTGEIQENTQNITEITNDIQIEIDKEHRIRSRNNEDKTVNQYGKTLINIIEDSDMVILNGRTLGDWRGKKTCHKYNGSSTVDYFIVSTNLLRNFITFRVLGQQWYTDHNPIAGYLKLDSCINNQTLDDDLTPITGYKWTDDSEIKVTNVLHCKEIKAKLNMITSTKNSDKCIDDLTAILKEVAEQSLTKKTNKSKNKCSYETNKNHSDEKVKEGKREFKKAKRLYMNNKNDKNRRIEYISQKSRYKKIKYLAERYKKDDKLIKLANIESKQPALFWKTIKSLVPKNEKTNNISSDTWTKYFNKLLNINIGKKEDKKYSYMHYVKNSLPILEKVMDTKGPLDQSITLDEMENAIKELKRRKASGPDGICNEILKCKSTELKKALLHVFNTILSNGNYPKQWMLSIITPIHKNGDKNNPENYRGIAVSDNTNKIFMKIILNRINNYMTNKGYWSKNQNGFMKARRTEDNIFILHTIFQKYVKLGKQKIYTVFVDFKKYFDGIDRDCLFYKLIKYGITGKIYNMLKTAYTNPQFCVKTDYGLSKYFISQTGVKQGCVLSPLLSNIFQNDLHGIFDPSCDPVMLNSEKFNSLSWADDLVLFSRSKTGLQKCLNNLEIYCNKWGLQVNKDKTKCMIMSIGNPKPQNFIFEDKTLENVNYYKYLGVQVQRNGKYKNAIAQRISKANRAIHVLKQILGYSTPVSAKLAMSLFDKQIVPIILYGSVLWGIPDSNRYIKIQINKLNVKIKSQVQSILNKRMNRDIKINEIKVLRSKGEVLVKLNNSQDKIDLIYSNKSYSDNYLITNHDMEEKNNYESVHKKYCKYVIGVPKFASATAAMKEMKRYPIQLQAYVNGISYWHRLHTTNINPLLSAAFNVCKDDNHPFVQNVSYLLKMNGMGNVLVSPYHYSNKQIKHIVKDNMINQYNQMTNSVMNINNKFQTLNNCHKNEIVDCGSPLYNMNINSTFVRKCFTYLRFDKAVYYDEYNEHNMCDSCNVNKTTHHVLMECKKTDVERKVFLENMNVKCPSFKYLTSSKKIISILNLQFNNLDVINVICSFVKQVCVKTNFI